jgi:hypothetical protein
MLPSRERGIYCEGDMLKSDILRKDILIAKKSAKTIMVLIFFC